MQRCSCSTATIQQCSSVNKIGRWLVGAGGREQPLYEGEPVTQVPGKIALSSNRGIGDALQYMVGWSNTNYQVSICTQIFSKLYIFTACNMVPSKLTFLVWYFFTFFNLSLLWWPKDDSVNFLSRRVEADTCKTHTLASGKIFTCSSLRQTLGPRTFQIQQQTPGQKERSLHLIL